MHRAIEITVPPASTDALISELEKSLYLISLSIHRGASIKPPGDVIVVHVLNRDADRVLKLADTARKQGLVSVTTSDVSSIIDLEHEPIIANDVDEALWEETETTLRHQSRITSNYLTLMALGGVIAATGLIAVSSTTQAISFVAAAIIAPGFEPLANIPLGVALRRPGVVALGLKSAAAGYLTLILSAAVTFLLLRLLGVAGVEQFIHNYEVKTLSHIPLREALVSGCGAVAGMTMVLSHRRYTIPGALVALSLIPAAAMIGVALAAGQPALMYQGAQRVGLDVLLIIPLGIFVVLLKQAIVHRREPMV
ncbi:MAG: DUF389 domain-containing protein [Pseudomonadota bacterium]|nr:DUF389 domain-containing protein [Pseudomonadota bacterium]